MTNLPKILCVDDEENILHGLQRVLIDNFDVTTASSGAEALALMKNQEFMVILSDMRMPEMSGAEFLSKARAQFPDTTRMLLTGQADLESAMKAINDGNIFRFLIKPCPEEKLIANIIEGIHLHQLVKSEKDLLENTLKGAIKVLIDTLSTIAPSAFSRSTHIKNYVQHMAKLSHKSSWEFEIAAMLSQVGAIILPPDTLQKAFSAIPLDDDEQAMFNAIPAAGAKLVGSIPRLENIALMIESQSASDKNLATLTGKVLTGARMLRIANTIDRMVLRENINIRKSLEILGDVFNSPEDHLLLKSLSSYKNTSSSSIAREVIVNELKSGMILEADVLAENGSTVLCKGQELNGPLIDRLHNFSKGVGIREPINVLSKDN
jgi:response regulator RpfG family c-di-GMP phosphodiesterase